LNASCVTVYYSAMLLILRNTEATKSSYNRKRITQTWFNIYRPLERNVASVVLSRNVACSCHFVYGVHVPLVCTHN